MARATKQDLQLLNCRIVDVRNVRREQQKGNRREEQEGGAEGRSRRKEQEGGAGEEMER